MIRAENMNKNQRFFYEATHLMIKIYYLSDCGDDIAALASDMSLGRISGITADPAIWDDWEDAIKQVKGSDVVPENLTIEEGYQAAINFFNFQADLRSSEDLKKFIETLTYEKWLEAVEAVDNDKDEILQR